MSACAAGTDNLRVIHITPVSARETSYQLPYSVGVEFSEIQNNRYGEPVAVAIARLSKEDLQESLSGFLEMRGTFRKVKKIPGNLADLILQANLVLSVNSDLTTPQYSVAMDVKLLDQENACLGVYRESADATVKLTVSPFLQDGPYWEDRWLNPVNQVVNLAFEKISRRVEQDLVQNKIRPPTAPVSRARRAQVADVLAEAFRSSTRTDVLTEAVADQAALGVLNIGRSLLETVARERSMSVLQAKAEALWKTDGESTIGILARILWAIDEVWRANAALALGSIGARARDAIPVLIETFPQTRGVKRFPETGRVAGSQRQAILPENCVAFLRSVSLEVREVTPALIRALPELVGLEDCRNYVEADPVIRSTYSLSGRILVFSSVGYTFYAGAYALRRITGQEIGMDRRKWQQWWESRGKNDN